MRALGEVFINSDGESEYRIELIFPELPNTRRIRLVRMGDGKIRIEFFEIPNDRIAENIILRISEINTPLSIAADLIERKFGQGIIVGTIRRTFAPILFGADMSVPGYLETVKAETKRVEEESRVVRLIRSVVDRFFKETPEDDKESQKDKNTEKKQKKKTILGGVIEKINRKKQQ